MSIFKIPITKDETFYQQTMGFDGQQYALTFRLNTRNDTWYMTITDPQANVVIRSKPCLTNVLEFTSRLVPGVFLIGEIMFLSFPEDDCSEDNFGTGVQMFYQNIVGETA